MEIVEFIPGDWSGAVELPVRSGKPSAKMQKSSTNNSKTARSSRNAWRPRLSGRILTEAQEVSRQQTREHQMHLVITAGGKPRFTREVQG